MNKRGDMRKIEDRADTDDVKRVVIVTRYPPFGQTHSGRGIGSYSKLLATQLANLGLEVTIVAEKLSKETEVYEEDNVAVWRVWQPGIRAARDIERAVQTIRPDVVHFQHELFVLGKRGAVFAAPRAVRSLRKLAPTITTIHGVIPQTAFSNGFVSQYVRGVPPVVVRLVYTRIIKSLLANSNHVVAHNAAVAAELESLDTSKHVQVIEHGHHSPGEMPSRAEALANLGLTDKVRAVFFGYLLPYKGVDVLVSAAPILETQGISVLVAGEEPDDAGSISGASIPKSDRNVERLGFVDEKLIPSLMAISDVLVFPYRVGLAASGPLSIASSYGVPVVVSDVPTLAEAVREPRATAVREDSTDLARVIQNVIVDDDLQSQIIIALRTNASKSDWATVARKTAYLYDPKRKLSVEQISVQLDNPADASRATADVREHQAQ